MLMFLGIYISIGMICTLIVMIGLGRSYNSFKEFIYDLKVDDPETLMLFNTYPKSMEFSFWLILTLGWWYFLYKALKTTRG